MTFRGWKCHLVSVKNHFIFPTLGIVNKLSFPYAFGPDQETLYEGKAYDYQLNSYFVAQLRFTKERPGFGKYTRYFQPFFVLCSCMNIQ